MLTKFLISRKRTHFAIRKTIKWNRFCAYWWVLPFDDSIVPSLWFRCELEWWKIHDVVHKTTPLQLILCLKMEIRNEMRSANTHIHLKCANGEIPFKWPGNRLRFNFLKMAENKSQTHSHCAHFIDPFYGTIICCAIHLFDWPFKRTAPFT